jgi:hypothetical protein
LPKTERLVPVGHFGFDLPKMTWAPDELSQAQELIAFCHLNYLASFRQLCSAPPLGPDRLHVRSTPQTVRAKSERSV